MFPIVLTPSLSQLATAVQPRYAMAVLAFALAAAVCRGRAHLNEVSSLERQYVQAIARLARSEKEK